MIAIEVSMKMSRYTSAFLPGIVIFYFGRFQTYFTWGISKGWIFRSANQYDFVQIIPHVWVRWVLLYSVFWIWISEATDWRVTRGAVGFLLPHLAKARVVVSFFQEKLFDMWWMFLFTDQATCYGRWLLQTFCAKGNRVDYDWAKLDLYVWICWFCFLWNK